MLRTTGFISHESHMCVIVQEAGSAHNYPRGIRPTEALF